MSCDEKPATQSGYLRVGTKNGRVFYMVTDEHPEGVMVGSMDDPELAATLAELYNETLERYRARSPGMLEP